jgi:hypothetical protein
MIAHRDMGASLFRASPRGPGTDRDIGAVVLAAFVRGRAGTATSAPWFATRAKTVPRPARRIHDRPKQ